MASNYNSPNLPPSLRLTHLWPIADQIELARQSRASTRPILAKYQDDPHGYSRDILKVELTSDQADTLTSIRDNRYTLVEASHAIGKTFVAGVAANWWYDCWDKHICYITAPTWDQALGLTFKAVKTQRRELQLPGRILETGKVLDEDRLREGSHYIRALNAEKGEGFQGEHEAPILIIIEEGVGVPKYIWEAAKGLMTHADCRVFVIGNPTDEATEFGLAAESGNYHVISISALDHPNIKAQLQAEPPPFPRAVSLLWLYEMLRDECDRTDKLTDEAFEFHSLPEIQNALSGIPVSGETWFYMPNAVFQGRAQGVFPTQADQNVIPKAWLKSQPVLTYTDADLPELGCDVARFGDDRTTIFVRRGPCLLKGREIRKMDSIEVATACKEEALEAAREFKPDATKEEQERLAKTFKIKVDVTGGLGTGPYDQLKKWGYSAIAVNSSGKAKEPEQYKNIRSELWFDMRGRAREKRLDLSRLRKDIRTRLERELSAPKYKAPGHKIVEDKATMKARLGYSPDLADGSNLAFYQAPDQGAWDVGRIGY